MRLLIKRDQADVKGLFGGHKGVRFSLYTKAEITNEEKALIDRYKAGDYVLASYKRAGKNAPIEFDLSVNNLINGKTVEIDNIQTLLDLEEEIKNGCKNLLLVMSIFGGVETIEV